MSATGTWAGEIGGYFIQIDIAVIDFELELHRALYPDMLAPYADRFYGFPVATVALLFAPCMKRRCL